MGIAEVYRRFKPHEHMFRCPVCRSDMAFRDENGIVCGAGHCFDLSKRGYINFAPHQVTAKYTKEMFESRRLVFQSGFYNPLLENIEQLIDKYMPGAPNISVLDAGCGEGFFTRELLNGARTMFAVDIVKDAVTLAARESREAFWIVGDLSNIPIRENSVDIVLNILAPANYGEFSRVIKSGGVLIKVVPDGGYLTELRERAGVGEYSNERVLRHLGENVKILENLRLKYRMPASAQQVESFVKMTPMMFGVNASAISTDGIDGVTVDVDIIVGEFG